MVYEQGASGDSPVDPFKTERAGIELMFAVSALDIDANTACRTFNEVLAIAIGAFAFPFCPEVYAFD